MIATAGSGHTASSLGLVECFVALYDRVLRFDAAHPGWKERDRMIVSNGHVAPVWYAVLAESGFFPISELTELRKHGSRLQGHPVRGMLPGVENSSGSLGQGLGFACGLAVASRLRSEKYHVFCLMGDGEQQEGSVWESYWFAGQHSLGNLTAIVDLNEIQSEGKTIEILSLQNIVAKLQTFGWETIEVDGHDLEELSRVFTLTRRSERPTAVLMHTIPGKGVSFMEGDPSWHARAPNAEELAQALQQLKQEKESNGTTS